MFRRRDNYRDGRGNYRGMGRKEKYKSPRAYVLPPDIIEDFWTFPEKFEWISNEESAPLTSQLDWKEGSRNLNEEEEAMFISYETFTTLKNSKNALAEIGDAKVLDGKKRCDPFQKLNNGRFVTKSALKMANIDSLFGYLFTSPTGENNTAKYKDDEMLTFADICGAPGGFAQYILWRKNNKAKGIGITLKTWRNGYINELKNSKNTCFEVHYGLYDSAGDGNIFYGHNIVEFTKFVLSKTKNEGVHFAMAEGAYNPVYKFPRIILCQIATSLLVIKAGGHLVIKIFDIINPFMAGLVYILFRCFKSISIVKPVLCCSDNCERFIICKSKVADTSFITNYLLDVNIEMERIYSGDKHSDSTIKELLPIETILSDRKFCDYLTASNEKIAKADIQFLKKLKVFALNEELYDASYGYIPTKCVALWHIPNEHADYIPPSDDDDVY